MRHLVLGTAGHIDHGKSSLVQALTGVDPDRLKEEQRRGITIELGFADLAIDDDRVISFVDVPGHERFVRHMVAGATGIQAVLMVVAADQGAQPQTREHLEICRLLGVRRGVVALTKTDLVDPDLAEVAALESRELFEGTFLEQAPLVPVSAKTGRGLDELREQLADLFPAGPEFTAPGAPRLPVDRSFVLRGFGTVVTGTLVSGELSEGQEVEFLPGGGTARIRGLQVHRRKVDHAVAGRRTAVNLQGVSCEDVPRGSTLTRRGALRMTRRVWARVELLAHAPRSLRREGPLRFHQATYERAARLRVLAEGDDGSLHAELYFDRATVIAPGDRFILRRPAPLDTIGGGVVVDSDPPHPKDATAAAFAADAVEPAVAIASRLQRAGARGCDPVVLAAALGAEPAQVIETARQIEQRGAAFERAGRWFDAAAWSAIETAIDETLGVFHRDEPLQLGMDREALRAAVGRDLPQDAWRVMLEGLAAQGRLRLDQDRVAAANHDVTLDSDQERLSAEIESRMSAAGLEPPDAASLLGADPKQGRRILDLLIARRRLIRLPDGKLFHCEALEDLRQKLREYAKSSKTIGVAEFKTLAGVTRKNAIPLLEFLDAERTTRRAGDRREIL